MPSDAPQTNPLVVAVDGPSGSGKSSVSRAVATKLDYRYLDTGAMYRSAALAAMQGEVDLDDSDAVEAMLNSLGLDVTTDPQAPGVSLRGTPVNEEIRSKDVTNHVSKVSAIPAVRTYMVDRQRDEVRDAKLAGTGIVVEGRDIGTTVLPNADLKVFLTADQEARAERRAKQDELEGRTAEVDETSAALAARDKADSQRKASPLTKADDAVGVDATFLDLDGVIDVVLDLIAERQ